LMVLEFKLIAITMIILVLIILTLLEVRERRTRVKCYYCGHDARYVVVSRDKRKITLVCDSDECIEKAKEGYR